MDDQNNKPEFMKSPVGMWEVSYSSDTTTYPLGIYEGHLLDIIYALSQYGAGSLNIKPFVPKKLPENGDKRPGIILKFKDFVEYTGKSMVPSLVEYFDLEKSDVECEIAAEKSGWGHYGIKFPKIYKAYSKIQGLQDQIDAEKAKL